MPEPRNVGEGGESGGWVCSTHQDSTRVICPCVGFDGRCHECDDPERRPACQSFVPWIEGWDD